MSRYLIYVLLLIIPATVFAQKVYKWTDANGKTHYGDKPGQATQSKKVILKTNKRTPKPAPSKIESEALAEEAAADTAATGVEAQPNFDQCISLAKQKAKLRQPFSPKSESLHKKLKSLCPNTSFTCYDYSYTPSKSSCTAKPGDSKGTSFTVHNKARWSASDK